MNSQVRRHLCIKAQYWSVRGLKSTDEKNNAILERALSTISHHNL